MIVKSRCLEFEGYIAIDVVFWVNSVLSDNQTFFATRSSREIDTRVLGVWFNADHHDLLILVQRKCSDCSDIQYRHFQNSQMFWDLAFRLIFLKKSR